MKKIFVYVVMASACLSGYSQNAIVSSSQDASNFLGAYFSPFAETIGIGLNRGWYNTAKPHKIGGFDVSLSLNLITINDELSSFDVNSLDNFSSSSSSTPTVLGSGEGATINYDFNGISNEFVMPDQNTNLTAIPIPTLNAGVGLIKGTEINVRYIPSYKFDIGFVGKGSVDLFGVGLKHDILQWIPLNKALPFDLSVQGAFSQFKTSFEVESQSVKQEVGLDVRASTFNLIFSKKFAFLTAYASIGKNTINSTFTGNTNFKLGSSNTLEFDLPLEIDFPQTSELQTSAGVRLQLAILTLYANQSFSKNPVSTLGIGISFR